MLAAEIQTKRDKIITLCQKHKVLRLFVFGSASNERFDPETSDIDFIAELANMPPEQKGLSLLNFWSDLENLFERKIDLLTNSSIKNPYLKEEIEKSKVLFYEQQG
jgi:predicted nucleotidyltransferase